MTAAATLAREMNKPVAADGVGLAVAVERGVTEVVVAVTGEEVGMVTEGEGDTITKITFISTESACMHAGGHTLTILKANLTFKDTNDSWSRSKLKRCYK